MKTLHLDRIPDFTHKDYVKRPALDSDYSTLITESCKMIDKETGELLGVYVVMPKTPSSLLKSLLSIKYHTNKRYDGLDSTSRVFGYSPRMPARNNFCSSTSLAVENPAQHQIICDFALELTKYYKKHCGVVFT